jgi:hypothetical protein
MLFVFHRLYIEQQIPTRPVNNNRRKLFYSGKKKRHVLKTQLLVNNQDLIIHKTGYKKGRRDMTMTSIKGTVLLFQIKLLMSLTLDILVLKRIFQSNYPHYRIERKETCYSYPKSKKNTTKIILKKE